MSMAFPQMYRSKKRNTANHMPAMSADHVGNTTRAWWEFPLSVVSEAKILQISAFKKRLIIAIVKQQEYALLQRAVREVSKELIADV